MCIGQIYDFHVYLYLQALRELNDQATGYYLERVEGGDPWRSHVAQGENEALTSKVNKLSYGIIIPSPADIDRNSRNSCCPSQITCDLECN